MQGGIVTASHCHSAVLQALHQGKLTVAPAAGLQHFKSGRLQFRALG